MGRSLDGNDAVAALNVNPDYRHEAPEHCASVGPFYLDTFEVTVGRFLAFLQHYDAWRAAGFPTEGQGTNPHVQPDPEGQTGWHSQYKDELLPSAAEMQQKLVSSPADPAQIWPTAGDPEAALLSLPLSGVTWWEAFAFCLWDGGRLPTEAEWEFAAAGGAENRLYPWGNQPPDCHLANFADCPSPGRLAPAGSAVGAGRFGQLDLAGSMLEWMVDPSGDYPSRDGEPLPCDNCLSGVSRYNQSARGGGYTDPPLSMRGAWRIGLFADARIVELGLRCARNLP
jgi:formylglycine-generating enzyme required for sulfatase activity